MTTENLTWKELLLPLNLTVDLLQRSKKFNSTPLLVLDNIDTDTYDTLRIVLKRAFTLWFQHNQILQL